MTSGSALPPSVSVSEPRPLDLGVSKRYTQSVFRFPGSFHPPLVRSLLRHHRSAKIIGDSMVGSGTTAVTAVTVGRDAVVGDIDPLACLVTRAKSRPIVPDDLRALVTLILDEVGPVGYHANVRVTPRKALAAIIEETPFRPPFNVYHWFHPTVARDLARILAAAHRILETRPEPERDAVMTSIASTIRRVSRADPQPVSGLEVTAEQRKKLSNGLRFDLVAELWGRVEVLAEGYRQMLAVPKLGRALVIQGDARVWSRTCASSGFLPQVQIVSPPYLSAIEYWRRHRLEYDWLGLVPGANYTPFKRGFFGTDILRPSVSSRLEDGLPADVIRIADGLVASRFIHDANRVRQYFLDCRSWVGELANVSQRADGDLYVVVGPSKVRGIAVDTPRHIAEVAAECGLETVDQQRYLIANRRMQYPLRNDAGIHTETILHFRPN